MEFRMDWVKIIDGKYNTSKLVSLIQKSARFSTFFFALLFLNELASSTNALNLALLENDESEANGGLSVALTASICRYCLCDEHSATVICNSERRIHLKVVSLPPWVETFRAHNLSIRELPHFTYHARLKTLRINFCELESLNPLALVPLPALETLDFADNALTQLPENVLERATRLKTLNLARNQFTALKSLKLRLSTENYVLNELVLSGNHFCHSASDALNFAWPAAKHLRMAYTNLLRLNSTHIFFKACGKKHSANHQNAILPFPRHVLAHLEHLDLSDNVDLQIEADVLSVFTNLSTISLRHARNLPREMLDWLKEPSTRLRHLDLRGAQFRSVPASTFSSKFDSQTEFTDWQNFCGANLEWLDVSEMALERLELGANCGIQWLFADDNRLTNVKIQKRAVGISELKTLHLDNNRLREWPLASDDDETSFKHKGEKFSSKYFYDYEKLHIVDNEDLRYNTGNLQVKNLQKADVFLEAKPGLHYPTKHGCFDDLEILSLANNSISGAITRSMLGALSSLIHLDISGNRVTEIYSNIPLQPPESTALKYFEIVRDDLQNEVVNSRLEFLNLSSNSLKKIGSANFPLLPSLAVLDASDNAFGTITADALFKHLPSLQHLHLARNPHLGQQDVLLNIDHGELEISELAPNLVELDLSNCALRKIPDLSSFSRLSAVYLAKNLFRDVDARYLPHCLVALDLSENRIEHVENFTDAQLSCLKHLDLARNSLQCQCSTQMYASVLQEQDEFYDRMEYYCFSSDGWQHPLSAFLDASADNCRRNYAIGETNSYGMNVAKYSSTIVALAPIARILRFVGIMILFNVLAGACTFALMKICRAASTAHKLMPFSYKLIPQAEAPVNL